MFGPAKQTKAPTTASPTAPSRVCQLDIVDASKLTIAEYKKLYLEKKPFVLANATNDWRAMKVLPSHLPCNLWSEYCARLLTCVCARVHARAHWLSGGRSGMRPTSSRNSVTTVCHI